MNKQRVLVFVDWYLPGYKGGGITTSCAGLIQKLDGKFHFRIVTRDTDYKSSNPFPNIKSNEWTSLSPTTQINYLSASKQTLAGIYRILKKEKYDVVYLNSLFSFYFSILPILILKFSRRRKKIILAPMGMLNPAALRFKSFKKKCFLFWCKLTAFYNNIIWHAASVAEQKDISMQFPKAKVTVASYIFNPTQVLPEVKIKTPGEMRLVYISRISQEKNLLAALHFLQKIKPEGHVIFDIYGPIEDLPYWKKCKAEIAKLPANVTCNYCGELNHADVINTFKAYHFSILPTTRENFGQIIPESLIAGTPIITSDKTPWNAIAKAGAGWTIPLSNEAEFIQQIETCIAMNQAQYDVVNTKAYNFAVEVLDNKKVNENLIRLFDDSVIENNVIRKKKVLILIDWYLPGFKAGGPIQSVANLVAQLKDEIDFKIITTDTDLFSAAPYATIKSDAWNTLNDGLQVYYFSKANLSYKSIKKLIAESDFDAIYLNSFFSKYFTIYPLMVLRKIKQHAQIIVAPRGMLGKGSLQLKSGKKRIYISVAKLLGLYNGVLWHASSEIERKEIQSVFGMDEHIHVARNLSPKKEISFIERKKEKGRCDFVFLSRIAKVKNLHFAIDLLNAVLPGMHVSFDIYGPIEENDYWQECSEKIKLLPAGVSVNYKGEVARENIQTTLQQYHFTLMPTFNENYGHAIVESFVAGLPVVISDRTPWRNLEKINAGWDIPLDDKIKFVEVLNACIAMNQSYYDEMSKGACAMAEKILHDEETLLQNRRLFESM